MSGYCLVWLLALCKCRLFLSSSAHMVFFNSSPLAGMIPVRMLSHSFLRSCSIRSDQKHWFISLISKQGPVTQREEKHILPVTFESQWAPVFFDITHQLATKKGKCSVRSDNHSHLSFNIYFLGVFLFVFFTDKFLMSCWHWWSQTSAGPSQFMMG